MAGDGINTAMKIFQVKLQQLKASATYKLLRSIIVLVFVLLGAFASVLTILNFFNLSLQYDGIGYPDLYVAVHLGEILSLSMADLPNNISVGILLCGFLGYWILTTGARSEFNSFSAIFSILMFALIGKTANQAFYYADLGQWLRIILVLAIVLACSFAWRLLARRFRLWPRFE